MSDSSPKICEVESISSDTSIEENGDPSNKQAIAISNGNGQTPHPAPLLGKEPSAHGEEPPLLKKKPPVVNWVDKFDKDKLLECNRKILAGEIPSICVRCGYEFLENEQPARSHIISKAILLRIQEAYCNNFKHYLYDVRGNAKSAENYKYYLLCSKCEQNEDIIPQYECSDSNCRNKLCKKKQHLKCKSCNESKSNCKCTKGEELLGNLYKTILESETHETDSKNMWVPKILSEIMLRGIFVINTDQLEKILSDHREKIISLWKFAGGLHKTCEIRLFLLPIGPIVEKCPIELVLRAPQQTQFCQTKHGIFLYTHFDCFHVVLPLDADSEQYFQKCSDKVDIKQDSFKLNWRIFPRVSRNDNGMVELLPNMDQSKKFPKVLIHENVKRYSKYCNLNKKPTKDPLSLAFEECLSEDDESNYFIVETNVVKLPKENPHKIQKKYPGVLTGSHAGVQKHEQQLVPHKELTDKAKERCYYLSKYFKKNKNTKEDEIPDEIKQMSSYMQDMDKKQTLPDWLVTLLEKEGEPQKINPLIAPFLTAITSFLIVLKYFLIVYTLIGVLVILIVVYFIYKYFIQ